VPGPCSVCTHSQAPAIDAALSAHAVPVTTLATQFNVTRDLLNWHRRKHLNLSLPHPPIGPVAKLRREQTQPRARERFLQVYAQCGNVTHAAKLAGVGRATVYIWEEHDAEFALAFRQAGIQATEVLEKEAWRRAKDGIAEPVYQHGKQVGTIQRYSDQLLMFLLRARAPERYRDRVDVSVTPVIKAVAGFDPADVL
jgi:hypothetical protein